MKEKLNDSFIQEDQSFIQEEEFEQQQETQSLDNQQLNKQQQSLENVQQDAQKTQQVLSSQEKVEQKIGATFPVTKDKVSIPAGATPKEPEPVQVEQKYESISGNADKDYDNVLETWDIYRRMTNAEELKHRIAQLQNVETNASRYIRWKISTFMNKNSWKYARYKQVEEMRDYARKELPRLKEQRKRQLEEEARYRAMNDGNDVRGLVKSNALYEKFNKRSLPVKLLSMLVGGVVAGVKALGRKMFAIQNGPSAMKYVNFSDQTVTYGNMFVESVSLLFDRKNKPLSKAEREKRLAEENETNKYYDAALEYEEDTDSGLAGEEVRIESNEVTAVMNDTYHGLLADQRALLALYKKGKKKNAKQIAQLEKQVDEKMRRINSFNSRVSYNRVNIVDANELERQLDKYRK